MSGWRQWKQFTTGNMGVLRGCLCLVCREYAGGAGRMARTTAGERLVVNVGRFKGAFPASLGYAVGVGRALCHCTFLSAFFNPTVILRNASSDESSHSHETVRSNVPHCLPYLSPLSWRKKSTEGLAAILVAIKAMIRTKEAAESISRIFGYFIVNTCELGTPRDYLSPSMSVGIFDWDPGVSKYCALLVYAFARLLAVLGQDDILYVPPTPLPASFHVIAPPHRFRGPPSPLPELVSRCCPRTHASTFLLTKRTPPLMYGQV
ncbi:hypothetical protein DENSPDRAFT_566617 [Dentipellis sp. KUC8613]|nr:hypothetical protein DENSPDRAFT_566617 [Dentipellis sp. KUC8613]